MDKPTLLEAQQWASSCLNVKAATTAPDLPATIMMDLFNWSRTQYLMRLREHLTTKQWQAYQRVVTRIAAGEPEQYVIGTAQFYGHSFKVTPDVLIPRQETEELVDWVLSDHDETPQRVLDIGTGSGVLAISLALNRPQWQVTGTDISQAAVQVAQQNADQFGVKIDWKIGDLYAPVAGERFDLIISNPPYISEAERPLMDDNVLDYEPHQALFAAHNGLALYERLAAGLAEHLTANGNAYFEIGFAQGAAVKRLFKAAMPMAEVTLKQDINGHDRMIRVRLTRK
ncbi:MAG TPA: peptide chain release factor N(5)-glutamine methyltransferase [Lactobacillus sp.]|nr:peptide chain release factor N(5)-glutamine methyltransferase [Lactobacillus sp.]